jgi:hypothetical protein
MKERWYNYLVNKAKIIFGGYNNDERKGTQAFK